MERVKIAPNFYLDEVVDPHTYLKTPEIAMDYGRKVAPMAQLLRNIISKTVTINNWWAKYAALVAKGHSEDEIIRQIEKDNGVRKWAGSRPKHCPIGASASAHRIERMEGAVDCVVAGMSGKDLFKIVEAKASDFYDEGVRRIEDFKDAPTWLHMDKRAIPDRNVIRVVGVKSFVRNIPAS